MKSIENNKNYYEKIMFINARMLGKGLESKNNWLEISTVFFNAGMPGKHCW
jgi:hypothetical protein